jgi:phospholipase C
MGKKVELTFGRTIKGIMFAVNPLKKRVMKTNCTVHKFINMIAIEILKNEGYMEQYEFYKTHIKELNRGVTWADQDFKSSSHFYHYEKGKGLYGFSDALTECRKYYKKAECYIKAERMNKAIFYLGAACHLVQDATVPQHVNNKLLKSHRKYELWIISRLFSDYAYLNFKDIKRYNTLQEYVQNNSSIANETHLKYSDIESTDERYSEVSKILIKEAQSTTAGVLLDFYEYIHEFEKNPSGK